MTSLQIQPWRKSMVRTLRRGASRVAAVVRVDAEAGAADAVEEIRWRSRRIPSNLSSTTVNS
jgi:hypothetical protein